MLVVLMLVLIIGCICYRTTLLITLIRMAGMRKASKTESQKIIPCQSHHALKTDQAAENIDGCFFQCSVVPSVEPNQTSSVPGRDGVSCSATLETE